MHYDKTFVAAKLRKWDGILRDFALPRWEELPALELYMDQVIGLLMQYLNILPQDEIDEKIITASSINNYVRMKIIPPPKKKRYSRLHIAYLIMICTLKQNFNIAYIQKMIPLGISEDEVRVIYNDYVEKHRTASAFFLDQVHVAARHVLDPKDETENQVSTLVYTAAVTSTLVKLLTEKLVKIQDESDLSKV